MVNDLRLAFRSLIRNPGFSATVILTLALGIGATTTLFSVVNGILLRSLPYPDPDTLVQVESVNRNGRAIRVSYPDFADVMEQNRTFRGMAAYSDWTTSAVIDNNGIRLHWTQISSGFFPVFGMAPEAGRLFTTDEMANGQPLAVVSYRFWQARLGGAPDFSDRRIRIGDKLYPVVGVMPETHDFPPGTDIWVPREPVAESRTAHNWSVVGRMNDGVSLTQAQQDLSRIAESIRQVNGDGTDTIDLVATPVHERLVAGVRPALVVLLGATAILLLVACVNSTSLLLARALSRDREISVRSALGATHWRTAQAFLAEALLLSMAGALLGLLIALAVVPSLMEFEPDVLPTPGQVAVDRFVLAFAFGCALALALIIGLMPAIRAAKRDARDVLAGGRGVHGRRSESHRLRFGLVTAQIAMTFVLLVGTGLLGRTIVQLLAVDPGFRTDGAVVMDVWLPNPSPRDPATGGTRIAAYIDQLTARLAALPGVARVGGINHFPLQGGGPSGTFAILDRPDEISSFADYDQLASEPNRSGRAEFRVASPGYFGAMGIPLIEGRMFDERDSRDGTHVALISRDLAATRWPGEDPLGKLIFFGNMDGDLKPLTVIGVVGDVQEYGIGSRPMPTLYADIRQRPNTAGEFRIAIQGNFDGAATIASARRIARELDPQVPTEFRELESLVETSLGDRRFVLVLLGLFGGIALLLSTMGTYGMFRYLTLQRSSEVGVRVALGARSGDIMRLYLKQGAALAGAGITIGAVAALASSRLLTGFLYGVDVADAYTYMAVAGTLFGIALAATWIPAFLASRKDPLLSLRTE